MNTPINIEIAEILFKKHGVLLSNISDVVMWLYEKHGIWIHVHQETKINGLELIGTGKFQGFIGRINHTGIFGKKVEGDIPDGPYRKPVNSPTEAYSSAIEYALKHLI